MTRRPPRPLGIEQVEQRLVLTANIYLDFGAAFEQNAAAQQQVFEDFVGLYIAENGILQPSHHNYANNEVDSNPLEWPGSESLSASEWQMVTTSLGFVPRDLNGSLLDTLWEQGIDYNEDGWIDATDAEALGGDVADLVRRVYEPFDVNVQIVASSNAQQVRQILDSSGPGDAYIFVAGEAIKDSSGRPRNLGAAWIDRDNLWDNVGFAAADDLIRNVPREYVPFQEEGDWRLDYLATTLANTAAHEAAHTFGLLHIGSEHRTTDDGDIMDTVSDARRSGLALATRGFTFSFNEPGFDVQQHTYQALADALGLKANGPAYVTGTGGHDQIEIVGIAGTTQAQVTVRSFSDSGALNSAGETSYVVDTTHGILVEASRGNDTVNVTGVTARVELRGGPGDDTLVGTGGDDVLQGDEGDDHLEGGAGNDTYVFGGPRLWRLGSDTIVDSSGARDALDFSAYQHGIEVDLALTTWQAVDRQATIDGLPIAPLPFGGEPPTHLWISLDDGTGKPGIEDVVGTECNDVIHGNASANRLFGRGGHDIINGRQGTDRLDGGDGNDELDGGDDTDRDELIGGSGRDTFFLHYFQDARGAWAQFDRYFTELGKIDEIVADYRRPSGMRR